MSAAMSDSLPGNTWLNPTHHGESCRRAWCSCSFFQTLAPGLLWGQKPPSHIEVEGSSPQILFQGISHCREVFFIQLRTTLWWYMGNFTPGLAAPNVDGCTQPLSLPLSLNRYPTLKMFPMLESKFLHPFIGLEFMAHRKKKKFKPHKNSPTI